MVGPQRAAAEERHGPRPREPLGGEPEAVRVWLLGGFRVSVGSRSIGEEGWRLKKAAGLVKLLALAKGHRLHRERAMELLWPGSDAEAAANNLHYALHVARRTLEPSAPSNAASRYLTLREDLLTLCPEGPLWVDVEAFEGAAANASPRPGALGIPGGCRRAARGFPEAAHQRRPDGRTEAADLASDPRLEL